MPPAPLTHIVLAPHPDDAVLSLGAALHHFAGLGHRTVVVTLCTGDPPRGPLSPFAQELHDRWTADDPAPPAPAALIARRRAEDLAALHHLGAQAVHLDLPDCIYRRHPATGQPLYPSRNAIFGPLHPVEHNLARRLAAKLTTLLRGFGRHHLYAPLAIGSHVDHTLTRRTAELASGLYAYYEDYPYAALPENPWPNPETTAAHGRPLHPALLPITEANLAAKIDAITHYATQISTFWSDSSAMAEAVRAFALHTGSGAPAERIWRLG